MAAREPTRCANADVATRLREAATLLDAQQAEPFRARAYRRAADTVDALGEPVAALLAREGPAGLERLPAIGKGIAAAIGEIVATGRWSRLDRLRGELDPEQLFSSLPGLGPRLARRIHDELHVDTLEALEAAAHDGRLEALEGFGRRRCDAVRATLDVMLRRTRGARPAEGTQQPPVGTVLEVDREYRERASRGELPRIAPRRMNPTGERWLPILHTRRGPWHFTALFSNTARAHELGKTDDWVVLYHYDGEHREEQCTVVTESHGRLAGRRVIRGREPQCLAWYGNRGQAGS